VTLIARVFVPAVVLTEIGRHAIAPRNILILGGRHSGFSRKSEQVTWPFLRSGHRNNANGSAERISRLSQ